MFESIVVGIDVSREMLEACWVDDMRGFSNDDGGYEALIAQLRPYCVEFIVIEATGSHEAACAYALQAAGFAVVTVNPRQAREFASSTGWLAKTGRIDARVLQRFAALLAAQPDRHKHIKPPLDEELKTLQALGERRRQLAEMLAAERDRLVASHRAARPSLEALARAISGQLESIEKQMARHLPSLTPVWLRASIAPKAPVPTLPPRAAQPYRNWARSAHAK